VDNILVRRELEPLSKIDPERDELEEGVSFLQELTLLSLLLFLLLCPFLDFDFFEEQELSFLVFVLVWEDHI